MDDENINYDSQDISSNASNNEYVQHHAIIEEENYPIVENNNNNNKISSDVSDKILKCVIDIAVGIFKCVMNSKKENQEKKQ